MMIYLLRHGIANTKGHSDAARELSGEGVAQTRSMAEKFKMYAPRVDMALMKASSPAQVREILGDGSFGGAWQRPDAEMQAIWDTGVAETRAVLEGPWPGARNG